MLAIHLTPERTRRHATANPTSSAARTPITAVTTIPRLGAVSLAKSAADAATILVCAANRLERTTGTPLVATVVCSRCGALVAHPRGCPLCGIVLGHRGRERSRKTFIIPSSNGPGGYTGRRRDTADHSTNPDARRQPCGYFYARASGANGHSRFDCTPGLRQRL